MTKEGSSVDATKTPEETQAKFLLKSYEKLMNADAYTIDKVKKECEEKLEKIKAGIPFTPSSGLSVFPAGSTPSWGTMAGMTKVWGDGGTIGRNPGALCHMARYYLGDHIVFDRDAVYFGRELTRDKLSYLSTIHIRFMTEEGKQKLAERVATLPPWGPKWASPYNRGWDWRYRGPFKCKMTFEGNLISWIDNVENPVVSELLTSPGQDPCKVCPHFNTM